MTEIPQADYATIDDGALLSRMLKGDEDAFVELYRRRQAGLYRFALRMTGSPATAEDAMQETFLVLMRRAATYSPERGSVSAFLYGIARNCVLRGLERSGDLLAVGDEEMRNRIERRAADRRETDPDSAADARLSREQEVEALRRAILTLPEHYRAAVVLCDLEELSYGEASAAIGCAVGTVRSRLHRGRAMLMERMRSTAPCPAEADAKDAEASPANKPVKPVECEA
jgi:RNA polymerase sigma-70 factor (ECF subfamily)